jgi:purine nucleosidase
MPLTNLAQAISLDPKVADLGQELVSMGGIAPVVPPDWQTESRREFNFWWYPEAAHNGSHFCVAQDHHHNRRYLG